MNWHTILFWLAVAIVAWLGLRNLISIITGLSRKGPLKPGQRLCHASSLLLYWGACVFAVLYYSWWPLAIAVIAELVFRRIVIRSGDIVQQREIEMLSAVRTNNMSELKQRIQQGADVNWQDSQVDGATALHEAVRKGNVEAVKFLLGNGSKIDMGNYNGFTALHIAAYCGDSSIVNALIEGGAEVNAKAKDEITPLHAAASMGHLAIVELLIKVGAEVNARSSKDSSTPKNFASREGHEAVVDLLSRY